MNEQEALAKRFETDRAHLRSVAYRMLGSLNEADDAVQETWLRLNRSDVSNVENLSGWLTTVVSRVCLDLLRSRKSRREEALESQESQAPKSDPEEEALMTASVGVAVLVLLDTLSPAERIAFVLHEMFDVSFTEIASIVERSPDAARQLASRARRSVRGDERSLTPNLKSQRGVVEAFLSALRAGDFEGLLTVLDPDLLVRAHLAAGVPPKEVRGARKWAKGAVAYSHLIRSVGTALVNGSVGLVTVAAGRLSTVLTFLVKDGKIVQLDVITDPERLKEIAVTAIFESE